MKKIERSKNKFEIKSEFKQLKSDVNSLIEENNVKEYLLILLAICSSIVLFILILSIVNVNLDKGFVIFSAIILFMINVISIWYSWELRK